ncbi:(Fe-S)-binding protein [Treponema socranskii]|uniref:Fe-S cluster n=1 Tax=Treponema socranskii subsp. socranskii VPI DR56BR1116 = ATCC 35536 TaxID=1125725 RepID=U2LK43_TRESO|nr:(Fe-S)-binding protein [Treponema socranskii]ERF61493.1 putative Fe-S cluster [Treponema socranskii subsp. socranskii VPI DR56BR1116 = ATCC 35536]ERK04606.1 putative Fe-S cluster [Treponema socranskii subsp. socranskii VPI DR56BR1116 = ATCC 35536]
MIAILTAVIVSFVLAFVIGVLLGIFKKIFYIPVDERVGKIRAVLPGVNCGACGYPGCDGFAAGVASGKAPVNGCLVGRAPVAQAIGEIMGVPVPAKK